MAVEGRGPTSNLQVWIEGLSGGRKLALPFRRIQPRVSQRLGALGQLGVVCPHTSTTLPTHDQAINGTMTAT